MRQVVISLKQSSIRRQHIKKQFEMLNIDYEFFDAINKDRALSTCHDLGLVFNNTLALGELGCLLSHILVWKQAMENNEPYVVVFEDDAIVSPNYPSFIKEKLDELMGKYDLLKLETMNYKVLLDEAIDGFKDYKIQRLASHHVGTAGYVITSSLAKTIIDEIRNSRITKPIDLYLFDAEAVGKRDVFQIVPALVIQEDKINTDSLHLMSDLEKERRAFYNSKNINSKNVKPNHIAKIKRETARLAAQINPNNWKKNYTNWRFKKLSSIIEFK